MFSREKITKKWARRGLHHLHAGLEELWIDLHAAALLEPSDGVVQGRKTGNVICWEDTVYRKCEDTVYRKYYRKYIYIAVFCLWNTTTGKIYTKYDKMGISHSQYIPIYRENTIYYIYISSLEYYFFYREDIYKMLEPENPSG